MKRDEEKRKAEQMKREEEKRKTVQAKPLPGPKPSPSQTVPQTPSPKTVKAITYFDESKPIDDPELNELLGRSQAARTAPKSAGKPAPSAAKPPAPQPPSAKPAPKQSTRPAATQQPAQKAVQTTQKTETLAIGGAAGGGSIPWLIELPVQ